jgi:hypothetical protein
LQLIKNNFEEFCLLYFSFFMHLCKSNFIVPKN